MASKPVNTALGLYRSPNQLGAAQDGGYQRLDNCVIPSKDVVEPRRGHTQVSAYIGTNASDTRRINSMFASSVGLLAQYGSGSSSGIGSVDDNFTSAILSDVDPPSTWARSRFADCAKRCYVTTDAGLKRVTSSLAAAAAGGLVAKITTHSSNPRYSASGQLPLDSAVMFRAVLVSFAPDGAEIVGPPSNRCYLRCPPSRTTTPGAGVTARATNVLTVTTTAAHGFRVGDLVNFTWDTADTGVNEMTNGTKTIASVPSSTTFTVNETAADYASTVAATVVLGPATMRVRVDLPSTAAITDVVRLYRSETVTTAYTNLPSDDVYQVFEAYLTAANVSAGYIDIDDNTPEVLLGNPAYFSPSVEGEAGSNGVPPMARDVTALGDVLMLGHLTFKHSLEVRLISSNISPPQGPVFERSGYTTLELKSTYGPVFDEYFLGYYTPNSAARDIESTAISLCDAVNTMASNDWLDAEYVSTATDPPGIMRFTVRDFAATAFTVYESTSPTAFAPNLPFSPKVSSRQEVAPADVMFSKPGQPDAFPPLQRFSCGAQSRELTRLIALREKAIALKEDGCYLVSGGWPSFRVDPLDDSAGFNLPDTAVAMDNQVFTLSSIGVVAVSESGVAQMGGPLLNDFRHVIEQGERVKAMIAAGYANIHCLASWGAADELEHRYLLAVPSQVGTASATPAAAQSVDSIWVYNANSRAWSGPWSLNHRHAAMWKGASSSGRMAFARQDKPGVLREVGISDGVEVVQYSDYLGETLYVSAVSGNNVTLLSASGGDTTTGTLAVGDAIYISATRYFAIVESITDASAGTCVVDDGSGLSTSTTVLVLKGYQTRVEPVVQVAEVPGEKQLNAVNLTLDSARFVSASVYANSEVSPELRCKELTRPGFGSGSFGDTPFGDGPGLLKERCAIPRDAQRGQFHSVSLRTREAGAFFRLLGMSFDFEPGSPKGVR